MVIQFTGLVIDLRLDKILLKRRACYRWLGRKKDESVSEFSEPEPETSFKLDLPVRALFSLAFLEL